MMKFNKFRRKLLTLAATALAGFVSLAGCTTVDDTLGQNLVPDNQQMQAGYLRLDDVKKRYVETRLYQTDSIISSNLSYGYMGSERNDTLGLRSAGFLTQYLSYYEFKEGFFGYKPIFDSATLLLAIKGYGNDTLTPQRYNIYEIVDNSYLTEKSDTTFYLDPQFDPLQEGIAGSDVLFTFTFPDGKTTGPATTSVTLEPTEAGRSFVRRLMLQEGRYSRQDGKFDPDYSIYSTDSLAQWVEEFKGLYIRPAEDQTQPGKGGIYATQLESSGFAVYGRNRVPEDESLIRDTIGMVYFFYDSYTENYGNVSVNTIKRDYAAGSMIDIDNAREPEKEQPDNRPLDSRLIVEGMGGVVSELTLTQEFFDALENEIAKANVDGKSFTTLAFSQALMLLYFGDSDYDWQKIDPWNAVNLTREMNAAQSRLGLYTNYKTLTAIPDYAYYYEKNYDTSIAYGGYIDRSRGCYVMNITAYMQALWNSYLKERNEAAAEGRAIDLSHVKNRTIYLGPEAYGLYTNAFSVLQGMATNESDAAANNAPIRFEFAYNLIK